MSDFIQKFRDRREEGIRTGIVQAVSDAEGLDVLIGGGLVTGLQFLDSYSAPGIGDVVAVLPMPGRMFVLGKFGTSGSNLGPNLAPNPGFEFGLAGGLPSGWTSFWSFTVGDTNVDWVNDEALAHSSGAAVQFTPGLLADGEFQRLSMSDAVVVEPGVVYRVAGWFKGTAADANTTVKINVHTAPTADGAQPFGADVTSFDVATLSTTPSAWTELAGLRTIPVDHFYLRVFLVVTANAGHTVQYVYADDVSLREQI